MEYFAELPSYVKYMSIEDLNHYFPEGKYTKAYLMRSIIMNEKKHYRRTKDSRTLRGVWYAVVKPTLEKLGLLSNEDQTEAGLTKWDATLSRYMGDLLRNGYLMYSDLGIVDVSRRKKNPSISYYTTNIKTYGYRSNVAPYPNIIIATEKDTVFNIIRQMADLLGCSCISAKGQNSLGAMELLIKNIVNSDLRYQFDTIYILSMTDYDPAGYYIAGALKKQVRDILFALGVGDNYNVEDYRIGIEPNQLNPDMVEANKYTPKPANLDKWFDITGGINGEAKGLELDALEPDEIRAIFTSHIEEFISQENYVRFIRRAYIKKKFMESFDSIFEEIYDEYQTRFEPDVVVDTDMNILELANQGYSSIPVEEFSSGIDESESIEIINEIIARRE